MKVKIILALFLFAIVSVSFAKDQVVSTTEVPPKKGGKGAKGKFHNSLGLKVDKSMVLEKFPFKVKRCDQMVYFKAKYISDMGDYRFRKDGFFSITAYYVNQFMDKDATKLDESILLTESKTMPQHLKGARGCVYVDGGKFRNDIAICLKDKAQAKNVLAVLNDFRRCRMGDNLQPIPLAIIRKLIRMCGKGGKLVDPKSLKKAAKAAGKKGTKNAGKKAKKGKKVKASNPWSANRKKYFHPLKLKVPGSRR